MKKWIISFLAVLLAMPVFGSAVFAEDNVAYEDGEYNVTIKALEEGTENTSAADGFIGDSASLIIENGQGIITIAIPETDIAEITGLQIEGENPVSTSEDAGVEYKSYELTTIQTEFDARVQYVITGTDQENDHPLVLVLKEINKVETKDESEETNKPDDSSESEEETGNNESEKESEDKKKPEKDNEPGEGEDIKQPEEDKEDQAYEKEVETTQSLIPLPSNAKYIKFQSSSPATNSQFDNPAVIFEKDGKTYIQLSGSSGQFIASLKINGNEVTWSEERNGPFTVQFEHPKPSNLEEELDFDMVIDTGRPGMDVMEHNVDLAFDENTERPYREVDHKSISLVEEVSVSYLDTITIEETGDRITMPFDLPEGVEVTISVATPDNLGELEVAGGVYEFNFSGLEDYKGDFTLSMNYDSEEFSDDQVDIYYYNESEEKWVPLEGSARNGVINLVTDHFSTYGVFAAPEVESSIEEPDPVEEVVLDEIDYVIYHETNDQVSSADTYFTNEARIVEVDGKRYFQLVSDSPNFIVYLESKDYGEFELVEVNQDGLGIYQVEIPSSFDTSDEFILEMGINVPGFYEAEHSTRVIFDVEEAQRSGGSGGSVSTVTENLDAFVETNEKTKEVSYIILQEETDEVSAAFDYFTGKALLIEKDGKMYLQLTSTNPEWITYLESEYGTFEIVNYNDDGSAVYQLEVSSNFNLNEEFILKMGITVPGVYSADHTTRVIFGVEDNEFNAGGNGQQGNGSNGSNLNENTPDKPELNSNGDSNGENGNGSNSDGLNPKTGENTNIMLYVLLMLASAIPLVIKARRHFA